MVDGAPVHRVRPDEDGAHAELLDGVHRLGDRDPGVVQRDEAGAEEALGRARAEVGEPAVVRPANGAGEARRKPIDRGGIETARRVEDGDVDALDVERLELALGVEVAPGRKAVACRRARRVVGRLERHAAGHVGQRVAQHLDAEDPDAARRLVAELRIDVALPQVDGLEHVAVGVDHAVILVHGAPPDRRLGYHSGGGAHKTGLAYAQRESGTPREACSRLMPAGGYCMVSAWPAASSSVSRPGRHAWAVSSRRWPSEASSSRIARFTVTHSSTRAPTASRSRLRGKSDWGPLPFRGPWNWRPPTI